MTNRRIASAAAMSNFTAIALYNSANASPALPFDDEKIDEAKSFTMRFIENLKIQKYELIHGIAS